VFKRQFSFKRDQPTKSPSINQINQSIARSINLLTYDSPKAGLRHHHQHSQQQQQQQQASEPASRRPWTTIRSSLIGGLMILSLSPPPRLVAGFVTSSISVNSMQQTSS